MAANRIAGAAAAAALLTTPAHAQGQDFSKVEITTTKVAEGVYMLEGAGGNIGLSTGADGAFLIDDQFAPLSAKILAAIRKQTPAPVAFLVNTHFHGDHSGGNEALAAAGARIVAHENVRTRLKEGLTRASGRTTPPAPAAALPIVTFTDAVAFYWNGQEIRVVHAPGAHTDGDAFVKFVETNVIHAGDVFFLGDYPFIDVEAGGDLDGYIAAQELILAHCDAETKIIPGHGALAARADLIRSVDMLKDVRARVAALIARGLDEEAAVKADPLKDLNAAWGAGFINGEAMTRAAYRSLARAE
jgi:glyoxylase-like metal-dependent hydrolase (beta-lactamase superfamily II)